MAEKCEGCKSCHTDLETLEKLEETEVDFHKIASYLGGTITKEENGDYLIHLGKENAGIHIHGRDDKGFVFVAIMRSKKLFDHNHIIYGVEKVKFSTTLAPRGKTKREIRDVVLQNEKGGIIIAKEKNKYTVVTVINTKESGGEEVSFKERLEKLKGKKIAYQVQDERTMGNLIEVEDDCFVIEDDGKQTIYKLEDLVSFRPL